LCFRFLNRNYILLLLSVVGLDHRFSKAPEYVIISGSGECEVAHLFDNGVSGVGFLSF
jgi:hypothetical protein